MKILSHIGDQSVPRIEADVPGSQVVLIPGDGQIADDVDGEVLITWAWGSENLEDALAQGVRWVHTLGTGVDRFPLHLVGDRVLTCSRGASAVPIAEWVMAHLLTFEKNVPGIWLDEPGDRWHLASLGGLDGRTLALIGLGGIGQAIAERALPFGMRIVAVRRTSAPSPLSGVEVAASIEEAVADADHVVLAAPATAGTHHLVDAGVLSAMKKGVHLVNISRGSLVDQDALRAALDDGRVAMASLDTVEPEPLPEGHWMYDHPKVRLTPHISWSAPGAFEVLLDSFIENLRRWRDGEPLAGVVDVEAGY